MKVAILGCGPAGLMAAHAAIQAGHEVSVISKRRKSEMYGAQYLHKPIPGVPEVRSGMVTYELLGTAAEYRTKVYGHEYAGPVSPDEFGGAPHEAWDIRATYDWLWQKYWTLIFPAEWNDQNSRALTEAIVLNHDLVISSLPRPVLCYDRTAHAFPAQRIWAVGDAPERGQFAPFQTEHMRVVCNGQTYPSWYRSSNVFHYNTVEWATHKRPPVTGVVEVQKPLATDCTCWPTIVHVGRYGEWKKGVLTHHAYERASERIQEAVKA